MGPVRFLVQVEPAESGVEYGPDGVDRVEFLLSTNSGEPLKPMARVASGGELSRVMLALKTVLADVDRVPVLIFDEIDTGVGGAVAATIGKRLRALGHYHQVLCITHLPQVASQADHHFCVEKSEVTGRTVTIGTMHLHVFPVPGITADGFTLGEDPAADLDQLGAALERAHPDPTSGLRGAGGHAPLWPRSGAILLSTADPGSFNGRTGAFGALNGGSSPSPGAPTAALPEPAATREGPP